MALYQKLLIIIILYISNGVAYAINNTDFLDDPQHQFWFDIQDIPSIELVFNETQWQLLLGSTKSNREEVTGKLIYIKNNQTYQLNNIGIKLSGNTSFVLPETSDDAYVQANFTLDFDEFVDEQTLSGISALKLKRFYNDSTFAREPLSNQIMQNFNVWTTHSSTYTKLSITIGDRGTRYYGVYRMNESVNRHEYLDKRFGLDNDGGFLWQGNHKNFGKAHFSKITESWDGVGDFDEASFEYKGKGKKYDEGYAQLVDFAKNVTQLEGAEFETYTDKHINMALFLKGLAAESVLGHWDGFWGNGNNYFVYFDESAVMHFIPYDTDNTLGTSEIVADSGTQNPINFASSSNTPLLVKKILAIDKHLQAYKGYIETLVTQSDLMVESYAVPWIEKSHALIINHLINDTGDNMNIADKPAYWGNQGDYRIIDLADGKYF
jgi:spore coat protein CotH